MQKKELNSERGNGSSEDITARIIDICSPIGKGQRGLVVSPPKAGKNYNAAKYSSKYYDK